MKSVRNKGKKSVFVVICVLSAILFLFLIVKGYSDLKKTTKIHTSNMVDIIDQRMNSIFLEINDFPGNAADDITLLRKLSCFEDVSNSKENSEIKTNGIKNIEKDFLVFLKQKNVYFQLRYIDKYGNEVVRVNFDGENYEVVHKSKLQDKSERYYFDRVMSLSEGEVYVSRLDLNIENGEIENRGTDQNPIYVPVIRYASPIVDNKGNKQGIIISNVNADYFLEDIRRFQREGEKLFLINNEGYYLAHPDRKKEFGFMLGRDNNFLNDYPEISKEALLDFKKRRFETENYTFSLRHIYPTIGSFETYEGSKKIFGENPEEYFHWTLVSVSNNQEVKKAIFNLKQDYLYSVLFSGTIILVIVGLVFVITYKTNGKRVK